MGWNYRIIRHVAKSGEKYCTIHEVYYNKKGQIRAISTDPMYACGENKSILKKDMEMMMIAFSKSTLNRDKIKFHDDDIHDE